MTPSTTPWDDPTEAPNGQPVCDNFRRWFADSKLVDGGGDPIVVYHGTSAKEPLSHFDAERQGQTAGVKGGFFFTNREDVARDVYAWRGNDQVVPVYLKIENPLTLDHYFERTGMDRDEEMAAVGMDPTNYFDTYADDILAHAKKNGHDGLIFNDDSSDRGEIHLYVVFDVGQIKSATANSGLYLDHGSLTDSENPDAVARATAAKALFNAPSATPRLFP